MTLKAKLNALVDGVALIAFIPSTVSGLVLFFVLPSGNGFQGGRNPLYFNEFLGLSRSTWVDMHNGTSLVLIALIVVHLILHWRYFGRIPKILAKKSGKGDSPPPE